MKKRIFSILLVFVAALLLVACGGGKTDPTEPTDPTGTGSVVEPTDPTEPSEAVVTINVTLPEGTPDGDIYISGDLKNSNVADTWSGADVLAVRNGLTATVTLTYGADEFPVNIEYKWTRGDWDTVEKDAAGEELAGNRTLAVDGNKVVNDTVLSWADIPVEGGGTEPVEPTEPTVVDPAQHAAAVKALGGFDLPGKVTADLDLPAQVGGFDVVWSSEHADVITAAGVIVRSVKNTAAKLVAKVTIPGAEIEREIWVTVYGTEVDLDATYSSAYGKIVTLNPLMSEGVSDSDVYTNLTAPLYGGDYDWEDAIANGFADYPGDFSKIKSDRNPNGTVDMPSIKYKRALGMAAAFPFSVNNSTDNAVEGSFGRILDGDAAKAMLDDEWIIRLRDDLVFEDDTVINADTFEYSFKQYLNGDLNNARANYLYNDSYVALVNAKKYYDGDEGITWEDVGFEKIDDLTFKIKLVGPVSQYELIGSLSILNLVHPASFEAGFQNNGTENNYGSINNPLVSYGPFTLANNWDDTDVFTFTRNTKYFEAWDIPFKHLNGPIIENQSDVINEFKAGNVDVAGVGGEFWDEFFEHENLYISPSNSFYRLQVSLERPDGRSNPILGYKDFRHALYLATDREDFANNVQPPSQGKLGYLSNIHQVSEWASQAYSASDKFNSQLQELGFSPETLGFDSERALQLYQAARAQAIADEHYAEGEVIKVQFLYYDAGSNIRIANWVKAQYEKVFNVEGEAATFEIELKPVSNEELVAQRNAGDFDLVFTGMSGATFDATFGMGYIWSPSYSSFLAGKGLDVPNLPVQAEISNLLLLLIDEDKLDYDEALTVPEGMRTKREEATHTTLAALEAYDADALVEGEVPEGMRTEEQEATFATLDAKVAYDADQDITDQMRTPSEQAFYDALIDTDGVYTGTFDDLFDLYMSTPRLDTEYEGQEEDLTNITAALEKALLDQMIAVPLFSSTSAAVYQNNVVRLAHAYHLFLGWGGMSYMYKTK